MPTSKIRFGYKLDNTGTSIDADSTKWRGDIVNIANSTYYANRSTTPYSSVSDLDTLVRDDEGRADVRRGAAGVTGRLCVIGSELKEDALKELFGI